MSAMELMLLLGAQLLLTTHLLRLIRRQRRRPRIYRTRVPFLNMSPAQILQMYRLDGESIVHLMDIIGDEIGARTRHETAVPPIVKILCVLHFCGSGSFQGTVAMANGISQPAFSRILTVVMNSLLRRFKEHIFFPSTQAEIARIKAGFYRISSFPNTVGAVDCTHFSLVPPSSREQVFRNRKAYHSINAQAMCDADLVFTHCCIRFPGSCHDSMILQNSSLPAIIKALPATPASWILGDGGYPLKGWLLTPYRLPVGQPQERYNVAHIKTRNTIERAFGILKSRFRCLHGTGGALMYDPNKVCRIAMLCCMLHNICRRRKIPLPDGGVEHEEPDQMDMPPRRGNELEHAVGVRVRNDVVERYFH